MYFIYAQQLSHISKLLLLGHATCLGDVCFASQDRCLHSLHVLASCTHRIGRSEIAIVYHTLPWVIALPVLFDERVVLFFIFYVIFPSQFNLALSCLLPLLQFSFSLRFPLFFRRFLSLLLLVELLLASLILAFNCANHLLLLLSVVIIVLLLHRSHNTARSEFAVGPRSRLLLSRLWVTTKIAEIVHYYFLLI